jgi:hypothetical protein
MKQKPFITVSYPITGMKEEIVDYFRNLFKSFQYQFPTNYWYRLNNGIPEQLDEIEDSGYVFYWENRGYKHPDLIKQKIVIV